MIVDVTQYLRPHGRKSKQQTNIPDEFEEAYESMKSHGYNLSAEMLSTGMVILTIENDEEDIDTEIVTNGPDVQEAIGRMLSRRNWDGTEPGTTSNP